MESELGTSELLDSELLQNNGINTATCHRSARLGSGWEPNWAIDSPFSVVQHGEASGRADFAESFQQLRADGSFRSTQEH